MKKGHHSRVHKKALVTQKKFLTMGDHSYIGAFSRVSPKTTLGNYARIEASVSVSGSHYSFRLGDFSAVASGTRIWLQSNNYITEPISHGATIYGDVTLENYTGIGSNSVVMPNNTIPEGAVVGAMSFVPPNFPFKPWTVYAGIPIKEIKPRDKESVLRRVQELLKSSENE